MDLNQLANKPGARKNRRRVGRGPGSGKGRTAGRGMKGQNSRSGVSLLGFEGGQMPLYRRLPKRGFKNPTRLRFAEINLGRLQAAIDAKKLDAGKTIGADALIGAGLVRRMWDGVRLLAKGELKTKVTIEAVGASKAAVAAVEKAGGQIIAPAAKSAAGAKTGKAAAEEATGAPRKKGAAKPADKGGKGKEPE